VGGTEVEVVTVNGGGDCGYDFTIGERYLVYAHVYNNKAEDKVDEHVFEPLFVEFCERRTEVEVDGIEPLCPTTQAWSPACSLLRSTV
jgi:hypothetical protein